MSPASGPSPFPEEDMTKADSPTKLCTKPGCSKPLRARGLCSTHYNQGDPNRHAAKPRACTVCGAPVARPASSDRRPVCSVPCRTALQFHHEPTAVAGYDWSSMAVSRARRLGATVIEPFDRETVFARDDWTCYLCALPVSRDASAFDPDSATVDHVVPLSQGGEHSMCNARTAHLRCNSAKQDRFVAYHPGA